MGKITTESIKYIKNVNHQDEKQEWAYSHYPVGAYFQLNFKKRDSVENHIVNLAKGDCIILSQRPTNGDKRYLTHVVELVNEGIEDQSQWKFGTWDIFRWVKVHWVVADFNKRDQIPLDKDVMKVNWGWYDTKAKKLDSPGLITEWRDINALRTHLEQVFN